MKAKQTQGGRAPRWVLAATLLALALPWSAAGQSTTPTLERRLIVNAPPLDMDGIIDRLLGDVTKINDHASGGDDVSGSGDNGDDAAEGENGQDGGGAGGGGGGGGGGGPGGGGAGGGGGEPGGGGAGGGEPGGGGAVSQGGGGDVEADVGGSIWQGPGNLARGLGFVARPLDDEQTDALLGQGWQGRTANGFASQDQRQEAFVSIARALGYDPAIGALQANFGTPQENGYIDLVLVIRALERRSVAPDRLAAAIERARAEAPDQVARELIDQAAILLRAGRTGDPELIARLHSVLAEEVRLARPGAGPMAGWEIVDLDVTGDGMVDPGDLTALGLPPP